MIINDYRGLTFSRFFELAVEEYAEREFIVHGDTRLTYAEVDEMTKGLAASLSTLGIKAGDHVAVDLPNWPESIIAFVALARNLFGVNIFMLSPDAGQSLRLGGGGSAAPFCRALQRQAGRE